MRAVTFWCGLVLVFAASAARAASFTGLGHLAGDIRSYATAVSADGSAVVGGSFSSPYGPPDPGQAFRWTADGGMVGLGDLPGGDFYSYANAISGDGTVVVGAGVPAGILEEAFRWTEGTGMVGLGDLPGGGTQSVAYAASADGSTIVGRGYGPSGNEAFRWTSTGGMVGLGGLAGEPIDSWALGVSADGSVVVGMSFIGLSPGEEPLNNAFLWTEAAGMLDLGQLPGGAADSYGSAVTPDGLVVVGASSTGIDASEAFRWTVDTGMVGLGNLPGGSHSSAAAISADGSVIVGGGLDAAGQDRALVWVSGLGPLSLKDLLSAYYGLDLTGWDLSYATGVSADGLTIVGAGTNPSGQPEAWIAVIPEPSTGLLFALGLAGVAAQRRARRRFA